MIAGQPNAIYPMFAVKLPTLASTWKTVYKRSEMIELDILRDVKNLLKTGYDAVYLQTWTEHLGLTDLLKECVNE